MSKSPPETNPLILVNGEQQEQQQDAAAVAAAAEERISSSVSLDGEGAAENDTQAKVQSVFQQVRNRIISQVGTKAPQCSILELVQRVKDRETEIAKAKGEPEGTDVSSEEQKTAERKDGEMDQKQEELSAILEKKHKTFEKALREEFEEQISQVRTEMRAYTDQALKDLECKMQSWKSHNLQQAHPKEQQGPDKRQKLSAAPSLASRRGRVLTRTMTTIIPKTCAPVIVGPRAKSETLSSSKAESSRRLLRDPMLSLAGSNSCQSHKLPPPACPPLHLRKKHVHTKAKTGN